MGGEKRGNGEILLGFQNVVYVCIQFILIHADRLDSIWESIYIPHMELYACCIIFQM